MEVPNSGLRLPVPLSLGTGADRQGLRNSEIQGRREFNAILYASCASDIALLDSVFDEVGGFFET